jgi:hypothetical protein
MSFNIKSNLSKLTLGCLTLVAITSPAIAQSNHKYPLDIELLDSTPVINNLRQRATVEHIIVHVGKNDPNLDPQPEMICPTAKSPTIQEWPSQSTKIYATRPIAVVTQHAPVKAQSTLHQSLTPIKSKPVPIASAYPFYTGSSSYVTGGKVSAQYK